MPQRSARRRSFISHCAPLVAALLGTSFSATAAVVYKYTEIDVPGAINTFASGINDKGQIVGGFLDSMGDHGFLYAGGGFTQLDVPGASRSPGRSGTDANGINGLGQIVGQFDTLAPSTRPFLYSGGSFSQPTGPSNFLTSFSGINDKAQIVGNFQQEAESPHGFLYSGGRFAQLDDVPGSLSTLASGINNAGSIVGSFFDSKTNFTQAFLHNGSSFVQINVPGAFTSVAVGINNAGQIVGDFNNQHGFLDSGGSFTQLDVPGASLTAASGVNDAGEIVGSYRDGKGSHGFLAIPNGSVSGDPRFTTFDGEGYTFHGLGDFVLARSTIVGDQFDVQIRTETWPEFPWRSIISEAAATLCGHTASIDVDRAATGENLVWIDGRPSSLSMADPTLKLGGCEIVERSRNSWEAVWDTGEILDITNSPRNFLNLSSWYSPFLGPNSVEGLLTSGDKPDTWRIDRSSLLDAAVLEPSTLPVLAVGLAGLLIIRRRAVPSAIA